MATTRRKTRGSVRKFESEKGFGFLRPVGGERDVFFHKSAVLRAPPTIEIGMSAEFEVVDSPKGPQATAITIHPREGLAPIFFFLLALGGLTAVGIFAALSYTTLSLLACYLLALNGAIYVLFAYDKSISRSEALRVPETLLLLAALAGGSLGLFLAQQMLRHKTRKARFQFTLLLIVFVQMLLLRLFDVRLR